MHIVIVGNGKVGFALAEELSNENILFNSQEVSTKPSILPDISSKAAIVIDRDSKAVLYGKNINQKRAMASTTKIMTAIIVLENCNLNETITVTNKAASTGGSRLGLKTNDKITMHDLLYGLLLCSRK